jgi:hypothetical protein
MSRLQHNRWALGQISTVDLTRKPGKPKLRGSQH